MEGPVCTVVKSLSSVGPDIPPAIILTTTQQLFCVVLRRDASINLIREDYNGNRGVAEDDDDDNNDNNNNNSNRELYYVVVVSTLHIRIVLSCNKEKKCLLS